MSAETPGLHDPVTTSGRQTAVIEIVESHTPDIDSTGGFIKPTEVRINGQALWTPSDKPIEVHGMTVNGPGGDDVVQVTLTLFARRVFFGHATESPEQLG